MISASLSSCSGLVRTVRWFGLGNSRITEEALHWASSSSSSLNSETGHGSRAILGVDQLPAHHCRPIKSTEQPCSRRLKPTRKSSISFGPPTKASGFPGRLPTPMPTKGIMKRRSAWQSVTVLLVIIGMYFILRCLLDSLANAAKTGVIDKPITLQRVRTTELDADFFPLPQIQLSLSAVG